MTSRTNCCFSLTMFLKMASSAEKSLGVTWTEEETGGEGGGRGNKGGNSQKIRERGEWKIGSKKIETVHY